ILPGRHRESFRRIAKDTERGWIGQSPCELLLELVVDSLRVPFGSAERADACRVALVLGWNLVPGRALVYCLSSFHFRLSPGNKILAEFRVLLQIPPLHQRRVSGYHRVDVLDRRNDLRKRLRMAHTAATVRHIDERQRLPRKHVAGMHRPQSGEHDERVAVGMTGTEVVEVDLLL